MVTDCPAIKTPMANPNIDLVDISRSVDWRNGEPETLDVEDETCFFIGIFSFGL